MKKKLFAILVSMAMIFAMAIPAFAVTGTETDPAKVTLTKIFTAPTGTSVDETFTFVFTEDSADTKTKAIDDVSITIKEANKKTSETTGLDRYVNTAEIALGKNYFPAAGVYTYTVTEKYTEDAEGTKTHAVKDGKVTTTYKYDTANDDHYTVIFGVATDANGDTYVQSIAVKDKDGNKVNASDPATGADANSFKFENTKSKKITDVTPEGRDPDTDDTDKTALAIEKLVVDKATPDTELTTNTQDFSFRLNVTKPANVTDEQKYNAQIIKADGTVVTDNIEVTTGTAYDFKLNTGERLVFKDIDVGASYTVKEADYAQYTKAYSTANIDTTAAYVTDGKDYVKVTNTYDKDKDPETGLSIANMPYIVLALVAVGGLCAYVVVRRKADDEA